MLHYRYFLPALIIICLFSQDVLWVSLSTQTERDEAMLYFAHLPIVTGAESSVFTCLRTKFVGQFGGGNIFEKYTEHAKRVVFVSRREAGELGARAIDTEHLLLGLLIEDKVLMERFFPNRDSITAIRAQSRQHSPDAERIPPSTDIPLSNDYKTVLRSAADEASALQSEFIDTKHLLLGILRNEDCVAAKILKEQGLTYSTVRKEIAESK